MSDPAKWFRGLGSCTCGCGRPATGMLFGTANQTLGAYAARCAKRRIEAADKERDKEAKDKARV